MSGIDSEGIKKAVEGSDGGAAQRAQYEAEQAAENARAAAAAKSYPRVMSSGGANDGVTVFQSVVTLQFDSEAEAAKAAEEARAEGRYADPNGVQEGNGGWNIAIELDPAARYPLSDHTGGR